MQGATLLRERQGKEAANAEIACLSVVHQCTPHIKLESEKCHTCGCVEGADGPTKWPYTTPSHSHRCGIEPKVAVTLSECS